LNKNNKKKFHLSRREASPSKSTPSDQFLEL
jgi:hypothetical protein